MLIQQLYARCTMERAVKTGKQVYQAVIPANFAVIGKRVRIDGVEGDWTVTASAEPGPAPWEPHVSAWAESGWMVECRCGETHEPRRVVLRDHPVTNLIERA